MFKNFVAQYKVILDMRKAHPLKMRFSYNVLPILGLSSIYLLFSVGIAYLSDLIMNFNYWFIALNSGFVGFYVLYLISEHKHYLAHQKIKYSIEEVIGFELITFLSYFLFINVLIYLVFLNVIGSMIIFMLLVFMSLVVNSLLFLLTRHEDKSILSKVFIISFLAFGLQFSLIYILPFKTITLNFIISFSVMFLVYHRLHFSSRPKTYDFLLKTDLPLVALVLIAIVSIFLVIDNSKFIIYRVEIDNEVRLNYVLNRANDPYDYNIRDISLDEGRVYVLSRHVINGSSIDDLLKVFDFEGELLATINHPHSNTYRHRSNQGFYISSIYHPLCENLNQCEEDLDLRHTKIYRLTEDLEFELLDHSLDSKRIWYIAETEHKILIFTREYLGEYDFSTKEMIWTSYESLDTFEYFDHQKYFFVNDGVISNNIIDFSYNDFLYELHNLVDRYGIRYNVINGIISNVEYYDLDTSKSRVLDQVRNMPIDTVKVGNNVFLRDYYNLMVYDLNNDRNHRIDLYHYDMLSSNNGIFYTVRIEGASHIVIQTINLEEGYQVFLGERLALVPYTLLVMLLMLMFKRLNYRFKSRF